MNLKISSFLNQRIFFTLLLSFSSGLPLALTYSTLQAWYTTANVSLAAIGALSLIGQPYVYKFVWAPFMDRFSLFSHFLGRRRDWIFVTQLGLVIGLITMGCLKPNETPWLMAIVALCVAFLSASQDIAFDAYRTDLLLPNERGMGATMNTVGYRAAMLVSGALALILANYIGWQMTYFFMAALMAILMVVTMFSPVLTKEVVAPIGVKHAVLDPLKEFFSRDGAAMLIIFLMTYKLADAFAMSLNTPFLLREIGFSLLDIGSISKTVGLTATLLGSLMAGLLMPRMGLYRALMVFGFFQMASGLLYVVLAIVGKNYAMMITTLFGEYFCSGLSTVPFVALLMTVCNQRYTATQFALLSAFVSLGRVFVGPQAAWMVSVMGWIHFYWFTFFIGVPSLLILYGLRNKEYFFQKKRHPLDVYP